MSMQSNFEHEFKKEGWQEEIVLLTDRLINKGYLVKPTTTETFIKLEVIPYPKPDSLDLIKSLIAKQNKKERS